MHADLAAGKLPWIIEETETLARHYGIGSAWAGLHAYRAVRAGRLAWEQWLPVAGGTLHPFAAGSMLYAESAFSFLEEELSRADGGEECVYTGVREAWVPDTGWCIPVLLADDLENGEHVLELSVHYAQMPDCKGSECKIFDFMSAE